MDETCGYIKVQLDLSSKTAKKLHQYLRGFLIGLLQQSKSFCPLNCFALAYMDLSTHYKAYAYIPSYVKCSQIEHSFFTKLHI